ncbi:hypothetical protein C8J57DRAFT_1521771 [Mycena rebaudengoi]|nr:hypothetical protein C8J57DRAFT_1521771 [Mycena rebaudengoi]
MGKKKNRGKNRASAASASAASATASPTAPVVSASSATPLASSTTTAPAATASSATVPPTTPVTSTSISTTPPPPLWSFENFTGRITLLDIILTPGFPEGVLLKGIWPSATELDLSTRTQTTKKNRPKRSMPHLAVLLVKPMANEDGISADLTVNISTRLSGNRDTDLDRFAHGTEMKLAEILMPNESQLPLPEIRDAIRKPKLLETDNYQAGQLTFSSDGVRHVCDRRSWTLANTTKENLPLEMEV